MYWSVLKASHLTVLCTSLPPSPLPHFNLPFPLYPPPSLPCLTPPQTPFSVHDSFRLQSAMKIV